MVKNICIGTSQMWKDNKALLTCTTRKLDLHRVSSGGIRIACHRKLWLNSMFPCQSYRRSRLDIRWRLVGRVTPIGPKSVHFRQVDPYTSALPKNTCLPFLKRYKCGLCYYSSQILISWWSDWSCNDHQQYKRGVLLIRHPKSLKVCLIQSMFVKMYKKQTQTFQRELMNN